MKTLEDLQIQLKALEDENIALQDRLEKVCEVAMDGHWDWHLNKDYEFMDARFWEIFGYLPEEKEHKPSAWMDMIHPEDLKSATENLEKHIKSKGKIPYWLEVRYRHKMGHWVWVICRGQVVEWDENGAVRMVGTHTDITRIKEDGSNV